MSVKIPARDVRPVSALEGGFQSDLDDFDPTIYRPGVFREGLTSTRELDALLCAFDSEVSVLDSSGITNL